MIEVSKITINGMNVEQKDGKIIIDGKYIDTGKYRGMLLTWMFFIGTAVGAFTLGITLILVEVLLKTQS